MAVDQLPGRVREFANYLNGLLARLDQGSGWCGVFWQRDPDGMQACLDGREVPPWDVVEALLHDLAADYGPGGVGPEAERARDLHAAALAAYDARPGGRDALGDRLDVMLREQRYAMERQAELGRLLGSATTQEQADGIRLDLAWARDDHERATARCAELRSRMADLDRRTAGGQAETIRRDRAGEGTVLRVDQSPGPGDGRGPGSTNMPHQRDARSAAESHGWRDERQAAPASEPDPHEGQRPVAAPADWYEAQRAAGAGAAERYEGRRADSPGAGDVTGASGWRDGQHAGGARAQGRHDGHPADSSGADGLGGASGRRDGQYAGGGRAAGQYDGHRGDSTGPGDSAGTSGWRDARHAPDQPDPAGADASPDDWRTGQRAAGGSASGWRAAPRTGGRAPDGSDSAGADAPEPDWPASHPSGAEQADPTPPTPEPTPAPKQRKRRRGGARFAGMVEEDAAPVVVPPTAAPTLPAQPAAGRRSPRGARFAGAAEAVAPAEPQAQARDVADRREVVGTVETLVRLRGEGRSGEAHVLLVEAAYWPAARFPLLAVEMQRAGLGADWATLLWEAASLPADRLVEAADALTEAGRAGDGEQILRQGVARPADEIGQAVLALDAEGRRREVRALLDAYVRVRTPEEAARSAAPDPQTLVPLLLEAAQGVSDDRHWDLVHALRVAGFAA
ncbi:hypothetical protein [Streptomyces dysideae]|uniref:UL36 very large tegument protein n=1 Tax=Streptomyces dysideae TaxID=909626 RepID=A0A101V025_9ACTN|nr:hypothetical protein [Streptomyces dysideae]KUO20035.1 hypothetical protein AQJ91_16365 [Streptomyces dysideae]